MLQQLQLDLKALSTPYNQVNQLEMFEPKFLV